MNRVILLEIPFEFGQVKDTIYPVVLQSDASCVLVDCGYTGFLPQIEQALAQHGLNGTMLTHVVLTHHDHDHMGALAALKKRYPQVIVVAGEKEVPFIDGRQKPLRLCQAEAMQQANLFSNRLTFRLPCASGRKRDALQASAGTSAYGAGYCSTSRPQRCSHPCRDHRRNGRADARRCSEASLASASCGCFVGKTRFQRHRPTSAGRSSSSGHLGPSSSSDGYV